MTGIRRETYSMVLVMKIKLINLRENNKNHIIFCIYSFPPPKKLTFPKGPRAFCYPFSRPQCPTYPSCQRSSENQTVPSTEDLHSYTVSRKHAVIIFTFLKRYLFPQ